MIQRPRVSITTSSSSLSSSSSSSCSLLLQQPVLFQSHRFIRKQHNYRHERYYRSLKSRHRFSRQWDLPFGSLERHVKTGHELEAFENFGVYAYDARKDPKYEIATNNLKLLDPRERYAVLMELLEKKSRVHDGRSVMDQLRLTLQAVECFEDICKSEKCKLIDLSDVEQYNFRSVVQSVIQICHKAKHDYPDACAAGMRVVQVCANVGVRSEDRRRLIDTVRGFVISSGHYDTRYDPDHLEKLSSKKKIGQDGNLDPLSATASNEFKRKDLPGITYLHPPKGRTTTTTGLDDDAEDASSINDDAPIRLFPDVSMSQTHDLRSANKKHPEELKNIRYLTDLHKFDSKEWKEHEAGTRWPTGEGTEYPS